MWGGRFQEPMAPSMERLNRSLDADFRLWPHDLRASAAWARALAGASVITRAEKEEIVHGLARVGERLAEAHSSQFHDEDIHTLVERLLGEEVGVAAGKLHTGRSRNDQVATDVRLWGMEEAARIQEGLARVLQTLVSLADGNLNLVLPGYTHLQQAQPISGAHWVLSHFWPLARDMERFDAVRRSAAVLPLGSGALAGCPFEVGREGLAAELGFETLSENSLDGVSDRDWMAEMAFSCALVGNHLSRAGEDLVLFSSREFGFVRLHESMCTGSSLMPQKRNPDSAELMRGKSGRLVGNLTAFLTLLKGLPSGYNRDLQEDKSLLFDSSDTVLQLLPVAADLFGGLEFREQRIGAALDPGLLATEMADYLVRKGLPFRESHEIVGRVVREAETQGFPIDRLPLETLQTYSPLFQADLPEELSFEGSVQARGIRGGTSPEAVATQMDRARRFLDDRSP